jgi:hypothetical protein
VKHCEAIDIEVTPAGAVFRGKEWPAEINVSRDLLDFKPGEFVQFGRMGVLRFTAVNGYAVYRRFEDKPGGWNYRLVENNLKAAAPVDKAASVPQPVKAERQYRKIGGHGIVNAFEWQPHAVPPVALPEWFVRADFEHNADGDLVIRHLHGVSKAKPADWVIRDGDHVSVVLAAAFAKHYEPVQ